MDENDFYTLSSPSPLSPNCSGPTAWVTDVLAANCSESGSGGDGGAEDGVGTAGIIIGLILALIILATIIGKLEASDQSTGTLLLRRARERSYLQFPIQ